MLPTDTVSGVHSDSREQSGGASPEWEGPEEGLQGAGPSRRGGEKPGSRVVTDKLQGGPQARGSAQPDHKPSRRHSTPSPLAGLGPGTQPLPSPLCPLCPGHQPGELGGLPQGVRSGTQRAVQGLARALLPRLLLMSWPGCALLPLR